jgi:excinuclease ABC subunit C
VDYVSEEGYSKQVREAILFLNGKKRELLKSLKSEMHEASDKLDYERAKVIRDKIDALRKITQKQSAILSAHHKDIDVVGYYHSAEQVQWVVLFIRAGMLTGRRTLKISLGVDGIEELKGACRAR